MTKDERREILARVRVQKIPGGTAWCIYDPVTGMLVQGPRARYPGGYGSLSGTTINGPVRFARKRDASEALAQLRLEA